MTTELPYLQKLTDHRQRMVAFALEEDIETGDITAELIPEQQEVKGRIITREPMVLCGTEWVNEVFKQLGSKVSLDWKADEGDFLNPGDTLVELEGNARDILTGERTALNFLQMLSGTATSSRHYAELTHGTGVIVLDTRKTIPGHRLAQKYAIHIGGCENHRIGLYDAFLIKENHISACGGIPQAVEKARALHPNKMIEVEVENEEELEQALAAGVDRVMLDNFDAAGIRHAINRFGQKARLEMSGNVDEANIKLLAMSGVDYISSGSLTKHLHAIDLSLRLEG